MDDGFVRGGGEQYYCIAVGVPTVGRGVVYDYYNYPAGGAQDSDPEGADGGRYSAVASKA